MVLGVPYIESKEIITVTQPTSSNVSAVSVTVEGNSLYFIDVKAWANQLASRYFANKRSVKAKVIISPQKGRINSLDVGDYVEIKTKHSGNIKGVITELSSDIGYRDEIAELVIQEWA